MYFIYFIYVKTVSVLFTCLYMCLYVYMHVCVCVGVNMNKLAQI